MIPLQHGLILAAILFVLGLTGLVIRRNLLFMLIGLEIMINASALAFVVAGSYWGQTDGQVMYILAISLAAAEASIGLALLLQLHRRRQNHRVQAGRAGQTVQMMGQQRPAGGRLLRAVAGTGAVGPGSGFDVRRVESE